MDKERFQRVRKIFEKAVSMSPEEQREFLDHACGDNREIRAAVEALLGEATSGDERDGQVAPTVTVSPGTEPGDGREEEGRQVGPYKILRRLGKGGMGVVYEALQERPVRRRVALKLILHGLDGERVLARFEAERQALALMNHPNVARVLDAGSDTDGRPYFVMELIQGVPITNYCDQNNLGARERLELVIQVCEGAQHAHQKGIIHRDLKPSNILVEIQGQKPVPRIIDFGVSKAIDRDLTERTLFTEFGQIVGTPEYMSPEQAEMSGLDVDTRTDVYSLGVVLYELLVGQLPFDPHELRDAGFDEMRRRIREVTPPKPSTRIHTLGERSGDVAKHRSSNPATLERLCRGDLDWITMRALEKDRTRRYASASELAADLRHHLRNEPVNAGPPGVGYRARKFVRRHWTGVVFATTLILAIMVGLAGTTWGLIRAVRAERQTRVEAETARAVSDFMTNMFEINDPGEARGRSITAKEVLDRGAERIHGGLEDRPELKSRLMETMGKVYRSLGLYQDAAPLLRGAVAGQARAHGPDSAEAASASTTLAGLLIKQGKIDEAVPVLHGALAIQQRLLDPYDIELARTENNLGNCYRSRKKYEEALPHLERALAIRAHTLGPEHPDVAKQLGAVGSVRVRLGDLAGARRDLERALSIYEKVYGQDHITVARMLDDLAMFYRTSKDLPKAKATTERALAIKEHALDPNHPELINTLTALGMIDRDQGDLSASERVLRRALAIVQANKLPRNQRDHQQVIDELGATLEAEGKKAEAEALERE